jgi:hypothetical protein
MAIGTAAAILGSAVVGGAVASRGASKAAKAQTQAAEQASQVQREIFERQTELQEPFRQAGITSQNELLRLLGLGGDAASAGYGSLGQPYPMADLERDPGYAFRLKEGEKALERMQSARGGGQGIFSGAAIKAGQRYGQDMASQEYQNAFNRAQALLGTRLGVLGSMYGAGQTAAALTSAICLCRAGKRALPAIWVRPTRCHRRLVKVRWATVYTRAAILTRLVLVSAAAPQGRMAVRLFPILASTGWGAKSWQSLVQLN